MKLQRLAMFASLLTATGCGIGDLELEKVKGPTITNNFALKIGNVTYTVGELVEDIEGESVQVVEGNDFSLSFVYSESFEFSNDTDFISIGDISNGESFSPFSSDLPATPSEIEIVLPTREFDFEFQPNDGEQVDSIFFKSGTLEFSIASGFDDVQIEYELTLTDVLKSDNTPVVFSNKITSEQSEDIQTISLEGIKNVSERVGGVNIFRASLDLTITVPAGVGVSASDGLEVELVFREPKFSAVFGNFGTDQIEVQQDTISIDVFEEFSTQGLALKSPSITMEIENTFGVEMGLKLEEIRSLDLEGTTVNLSGIVVDNVQFIDAPNQFQVGEAINSSVSINVDNSNIDELLNVGPREMVYGVSATPNPAGSDNLNNYLLDSSNLKINTTLEVPLEFSMDGFSRDFEFELSNESITAAESLSVTIATENEIPFTGFVSLSFVNERGEELYKLSDLALIVSPAVGSDGRVSAPQAASEVVALDEDGIDAFLGSSKVIATLNVFTFESDQGEFVKIFSDYQLRVDLSVLGKVSIDL